MQIQKIALSDVPTEIPLIAGQNWITFLSYTGQLPRVGDNDSVTFATGFTYGQAFPGGLTNLKAPASIWVVCEPSETGELLLTQYY